MPPKTVNTFVCDPMATDEVQTCQWQLVQLVQTVICDPVAPAEVQSCQWQRAKMGQTGVGDAATANG